MTSSPTSIGDAEHLIIDVIRKSYPQHSIVSEERGELIGEDRDVQWVIDPTGWHRQTSSNVSLISPVSIAGRIKAPYLKWPWFTDPMRNELFTT